jgi:UDP-N-acetylmuramyl pentapeptide phosphotransferase/UDP-N-acetylglucosamine-1-phosphate transferase
VLGLLSIIISHNFFLRKKIIDNINKRSSHNVIATRSGGVAIFSVILIITSFLYINKNQIFDFSILLPLGILFIAGIYDDIYDSDFKLKFLFQIIAAKIIVDQGIIITDLNGLFGIFEIPYMIAQPLTMLFIVTVVNSFNFTDGIDGLALFEFIKFSILVFYLSDSLLFNFNFLVLIAVSVSCVLLYFNFRKENKIFLGDGGSLFLGGLISVIVIGYINSSQNDYNALNSTIILYIYPLVDLIRIIILRIYKGNSPFKADKNHIHHILLKLGITQFNASAIICVTFLIVQILVLNIA